MAYLYEFFIDYKSGKGNVHLLNEISLHFFVGDLTRKYFNLHNIFIDTKLLKPVEDTVIHQANLRVLHISFHFISINRDLFNRLKFQKTNIHFF